MNDIRSTVSKVVNGDVAGQKDLFRQYYPYIMSIALRYTRNKEDAEEVLNDTFVKIFSKINQYQFDKPFTGWISSITVNTSIDHLRKKKNQLTFLDIEEGYGFDFQEPEEWYGEKHSEILPVLQELTPQYRLVFNLYVFEDYKHSEIAEKLNISEGTSKSNYARAKKMIVEKLSNSPKYKELLKSAI